MDFDDDAREHEKEHNKNYNEHVFKFMDPLNCIDLLSESNIFSILFPIKDIFKNNQENKKRYKKEKEKQIINNIKENRKNDRNDLLLLSSY